MFVDESMPGYDELFLQHQFFKKSVAMPIAKTFSTAAAIKRAGAHGLAKHLKQAKIRFHSSTLDRVVAWAHTAAEPTGLAGEAGPIEHYASARAINGRAGLYPSRYQSDMVDHQGGLTRSCNRRLRSAAMMVAKSLIKCHPYYRGLSSFWE